VAGRGGVDDDAVEAVVVDVIQQEAERRSLVGSGHRPAEKPLLTADRVLGLTCARCTACTSAKHPVAAEQFAHATQCVLLDTERSLADGGLRVDLRGVQWDVLADARRRCRDIRIQRVRQGVGRVRRDDERRRVVARGGQRGGRSTRCLADAAFSAVEDVLRRIDSCGCINIVDRFDVEFAHARSYACLALSTSRKGVVLLSRGPRFTDIRAVPEFVLTVWTDPGAMAFDGFWCKNPYVLLGYKFTAVLTLGHL